MDTKALRQKILDLAIRGKLVPQDPNDEPASVLLERIRTEKERLIAEGKIKRPKKSKSSDKPHYPQEPPFEIPDSWVWTTIEEICSKIGSGSTPKGSNYSSSGIPFFRSQNVYNSGLIYDDVKHISESTHQSMIGTEVVANDVLLNITGGSLGRCAVVPTNFQRGNVSQHVCILRGVFVSPKYLQAFILSTHFNKTMILSGSGREGLPKYSLEKMNFPLPPYAEQLRIVSEMKKFMGIIDTIEQSKGEIEDIINQTKSKILSLAILGKLVEQDPNDEPAEVLLRRINPSWQPCDTSQYENEIPQNWSLAKLGDIGKWQSGSTPSRLRKDYYGGRIPWLKTGDLNDNYINYIPENITDIALEQTSVKLNPAGSVLIAMYGATIGKVGILTFPATTNQACCACYDYQAITTKYLFYFLISQREDFVRKGGGGAQSNISKEIIINTLIPLPPLNEQKRIVEKIEGLFSVLDGIQEQLTSQ